MSCRIAHILDLSDGSPGIYCPEMSIFSVNYKLKPRFLTISTNMVLNKAEQGPIQCPTETISNAGHVLSLRSERK